VLDLIRQSPTTVTEIATRLGLTYNAVRSHLAGLERDGLIRPRGLKHGSTRPAMLYEHTPGADVELSRAYAPFASHLVRALGERLPESELDDVMRIVGQRLARESAPLRGSIARRVSGASALLQELGASNDVERTNGNWRIRGYGCLLATAVQNKPHVCRAIEALLTELVQLPVRECCERGDRPKCCFEIAAHH
jgi:predicted ArsR family transcriptional regulator